MHKTLIYQHKPSSKPAKKTIKLGTVEHTVVSPHDFANLTREIEQLKRTTQQQANEISSLRNAIRTLSNKPTPKQPTADEYWRGNR